MSETDEKKSGEINFYEVVDQAKKQAQEELKRANESDDPEKAKRELAEKIKKELKAVKLAVDEVIEEEKGITKRRIIVSQKIEERKKVLFILTKAIEFIRQGGDPSLISVTPEGAVILKEIAEKGVDFTQKTASSIMYYLGDFLLGEKKIEIKPSGEEKSEFQKALEELSKIDLVATRYIFEILEKAVEKGEISIFSKEQIESFKKEVEEVRKKEENAGPFTSNKASISLKKIEELKKINHEIVSRISEAFRKKKLTLAELEKANKALITPILTDDLKTTLKQLGLSEDLVEEYAQIKREYFRFPDFTFLESHAPALVPIIREAEEEFSDLVKFFSTSKETGSLELIRENRLKLADLIKKYYYLLLKSVHADRSKSFHENYSHHTEVQWAMSILRQIISLSCERLREILPRGGEDSEMREIINFLEDKGESFQSRIFTYASLFHDLPLYTRSLGSIEKIKEFFSFLFPSQLAEFFDDETGFMQMARDTLTLMIREYLVEGKNQYRGDFLSGRYTEEGVRWSQWFREKYKEKIRKLAEKFQLLGEHDEWKLDMVVSYAEGVGIATLIDGEILSTSDPVGHFKEIHPLMTLLSAKHNWKGGRGLDAPGKIAKFLLHLDINLFPEIRPWTKRLWSKKKWVPEEFANWVDKSIKTYGEKILETFFDIGGAYQELLGMFNLPNSVNSWNGWRIEGMIPEDLKKVLAVLDLDKYGSFWRELNLDSSQFMSKWQEVAFRIGQLYGNSGIWLSIGGPVGGAGVHRLTSELRRFLLDYYQGDIDQVDLHYREFFDEEKRCFGNRGRERIFKLKDRQEKLSLFEIRQIRQNQLRGEAFFRYLRRNPADFLMIVTQLCPDLLDDDGLVFLAEGDIRRLEELSDFRDKPRKTKLEKEQILGRQKELKIRWGEHFETLKEIHRWLKTNKGNKSIIDFIKDFNEVMITAYNRRKIQEEKIRREVIRIASDEKISKEEKIKKIKELIPKLSFYLKREDVDQDKIHFWNLYAGENGLFKIITGCKFEEADSYFSKFGSYNQAGEKNFFFTMAQSWFIKNAETNPFASDIPYYDIFKQFGTPGESTFSRLIDANIANYKEVVTQIINLEDLLLEASKSGDMNKIYELHKKVDETLRGFVGAEYARRANFVLSQVVAQFFMERSILRDPKWKWLGPIGWLARGFFGKNISLSKILTNNLHAYSMDNNALRNYFMYLTHYLGVLPEKGIWSKEHLEEVFEVTQGEFIIGDVVPSMLWFIALFLLFSYIKKAIAEVEGKKK